MFWQLTNPSDKESKTRRKIVLGIFIGALVIRFLVLWILPNPHLGSNAKIAFIGGAQKILYGEGFRDPSFPVFIPPLTAIFVAGHFVLFGEQLMPVKITQCILDAGVVVITCLSTTLVFGWNVGFLTGLALALYPFTIFATTYIGSEVLFTLLFGFFVFFQIRALQSNQWCFFLLSGFFLGLATLTRGTTLYYPFFFLVVLLVLEKRIKKQKLIRWGAMLLVLVAVVSPWTIRNYLVLNAFVPVSTFGGPLLQGSSENFFTIEQREREFQKYFKELEAKGIVEPILAHGWTKKVEERYKTAAWENYRRRLNEDPFGLASFMFMKFGRLWYATESGKNHMLILLPNIPIYLFAILGILAAFILKKKLSIVFASLTVYFAVLHCVSLPLFRYMIPVMPYVISFAMFGALLLWRRVNKQNFQSGIIPD